jgi:radical SAM superfamily enzyme YgiQ (UPF0313 family)
MAKLLFIQNLEYEFMGPMYISAVLKRAGHSVRLVAGKNYGEVRSAVEQFRPAVAAFPVMTGQHRWALDMGRRLKKDYGLTTLYGGAHTTFFPEFIEEDGIDIICRGEGEDAVLELLNAMDAGKDFTGIANLYVKLGGKIHKNGVRNLRPDIDSYPFCDRELYGGLPHAPDKSVKSVITSRGCVYRCTFCFEESMKELYRDKGRYVRFRSVGSVIGELREIKSRYSPRTIYFCDDVFGINKEWLYEFLDIYKKKIGLEFFCLVRADVVASEEEYAKRLFDAGCRVVFFGIETGSERLRNEVLKKGLSDAAIYKAAENLHAAGIKFRTYNILGLPDETLADAFETVKINVRIKADYPWCSIFSPYPRTELAKYATEKGYLPRDFSPDDISQSFFIGSSLRMTDIKKIENLHKFFQTAVLCPWTLPLIKALVKLPTNILFRLWFGLVYFYCYVRSEQRDLYRTFVFALRNYKSVLTRG